jgi:hypothetical protein
MDYVQHNISHHQTAQSLTIQEPLMFSRNVLPFIQSDHSLAYVALRTATVPFSLSTRHEGMWGGEEV